MVPRRVGTGLEGVIPSLEELILTNNNITELVHRHIS